MVESLLPKGMPRRDFLKLFGAVPVSSFLYKFKWLEGLSVDPRVVQNTLPEFLNKARRMGGFDALGYRLSEPWQDPSGQISTAYQHAVLQKDLDGNISPRNILDELSQKGLDTVLSDGTYGVVIPQSRSTTPDDYHHLPEPIRQAAEQLQQKQMDPGLLTAPYTDYGSFGIARFQRLALQLWPEGKIEMALVGDAMQRMKLIPKNALLEIPQIDDQLYLPNGCQLTSAVWEGRASYYSRDGCFGCSINRIMANGQPLVDANLTIAFMRVPLGTMVRVTNLNTGDSTIAEVTDRGNFELHLEDPRIADLSVGTKEAIGGNDITPVRITLLVC